MALPRLISAGIKSCHILENIVVIVTVVNSTLIKHGSGPALGSQRVSRAEWSGYVALGYGTMEPKRELPQKEYHIFYLYTV